MLLISNVCRQRFKSAIMKFLGSACLAILLGVSSARSPKEEPYGEVQINYYSDDQCSAYEREVVVTWASLLGDGGTNCFNYNYGTSANIAVFYGSFCKCLIYGKENCVGHKIEINTDASQRANCLLGSFSYSSFACYYY